MPGQSIITIQDKQWQVTLATTYVELTTGLSGVASLAAGTGMLFVLETRRQVTVDTSRMLFPLDIIFISENTVIDVASDIEPGYLVTEETLCDMFLEVNAGEAAGVEVGDAVTTATIQQLGIDFSQIVSFAIPLAALGFVSAMVGGMAGMMGGSSRSSSEVRWLGRPRTEEERAKVHEEFYGPKELPPRGTGLRERREPTEGRKLGEPKTEAERREAHKRKYGTEELPERGKGMGHPSSEEEATFPPEARKDLTFCKHMWDLEKTLGRPFTKEEVAKRWESWKELRYRSKTEEERILTHSLKYGIEELPERGSGRHSGTEPTRDDVEVHAWQERDHLSIWAEDKRTGESIAEWWDDEARQMFEDGFFKPGVPQYSWEKPGRAFVDSVLDYLEETGVLAAERSPATAEHHSMWLTLDQRKELEKKYGAVAVRWAEEATKPGDMKGVEAAAEYYYKKVKEALGLGHLSPKLTEEQIMKLREVLGLPADVAEILKIHQETGYIP